MAHGVTRELLACMYCQVRLPTSISQEQYINHIRVKHGVIARAEVERALVHLTQSKEKNPRLKRSAAAVLLPQPTVCPKRNVRLQTVVDGGCSSTGAVRPRLLEVEDEIRAENVGETETVVNIRKTVSGSKEELFKDEESQSDFKRNQGLEVPASRGSGPEAEAGGEGIVCAHQAKPTQGRVESCQVTLTTCAKVESTVPCAGKVYYSVALIQDHLREQHNAKDREKEFEAMEVEVVSVVAEETSNRLRKGKSEVMGGVERKDDTVEAEHVVGVDLEHVKGTKVKSVEGCGKMFYSQRAMGDHSKKTHGAENLSCPKLGCGADFGSSWGLEHHIKNGQHKGKRGISKLKNKKGDLKTQKSAVIQLVQQVKKRADIGCEVEGCLARFSPTKKTKEDHMRKEHGQSKLICQMCEASYFSQDGLSRHMKKEHKEEKDATKRDLGDERDKVTVNVGNMRDKSPIAVQVKEPEVEMLDMEIF